MDRLATRNTSIRQVSTVLNRILTTTLVWYFLLVLLFNFVSYPPHRGDNLVLSGVLLHLAPQPADMYHDRVVGLIHLLIPDLLKNLVRAEHLPRVGGQQVQD